MGCTIYGFSHSFFITIFGFRNRLSRWIGHNR
jgi:hypothetical protein